MSDITQNQDWVVTDAETKLRKILDVYGPIKLGVTIYNQTAIERYRAVEEILFDDQWHKDNKTFE